jgi:hypothetical protein
MRTWLSLFYAHLMRQWSWWLLVFLALMIRVSDHFPHQVETYYSNGIFPVLSKIQRGLLGWVPFSLGDWLYGLMLLALLYQLGQLTHGMIRRRFTRATLAVLLQRILFLLLFGYVGFNLLWGLNYNRPSLANTLGIEIHAPSKNELDTLAMDLIRKLDETAEQVGPDQWKVLQQKKRLFSAAAHSYRQYPTILGLRSYEQSSIKPSLFSYPGNYLGFQGYYNPFTGEAQVNTTIPPFLEPFVTAHEVAHQLGYAREQEANFIAVLVCDRAEDPAFRYSMYLDLFLYTLSEIAGQDTLRVKQLIQRAPRPVQADIATYRAFLRKHRNPLEQGIMWLYGEFLRANNQPNGKYTYNEVVSWVIAYRRTFGRTSLI